MARLSKHERAIQAEIDRLKAELRNAEKTLDKAREGVNVICTRIEALEDVLKNADRMKDGDE